MKEFGRLCLCEMYKIRHTSILWVHLVVPIAGAALFLWYYRFSGWESRAEIQAYFQSVACVWPFFCGVLCGMSEDMEEGIGYQNFLILPGKKSQALLAKWCVLMGLGFLGGMAAVMGFSVIYQWFPQGKVYSLWLCMGAALLIFAGQSVVYLLHLMLAFLAGKGASIGAGMAGTLTAFLFLTGLGDGKWMFFPWAWSGRFVSYLLIYTAEKNKGQEIQETFIWQMGICLAVALFIILLTFLWFRSYEGRRSREV